MEIMLDIKMLKITKIQNKNNKSFIKKLKKFIKI